MPRTSHQIGNHQVRRKVSVAETLVEYGTKAGQGCGESNGYEYGQALREFVAQKTTRPKSKKA